MTQLIAYFTFNGNCTEAMTFYKACFGGELSMQKIGESPMGKEMPKEMQDYILHSTLHRNGIILMGSDISNDEGLFRGNNMSILIECESEIELRTLYQNLSEDGKPIFPIETTFWGALFGGLTDQFGNQWLVHFDKNKY